MSQLHAVALQMVAAGMIELAVKDRTKVGTETMSKANIVIRTKVTNIKRDGKRYSTPTYMVDANWEGIHTY